MSEDSARTVSVDEDGIAVRKSFVTDEFQVPAVSFRLHSRREEPVTVRLTDTIPESFPMERIGFHPDHGSEDWTAYDDNRVEFEREIAPDEEVRTIYGIRAEDPDADAFLSTPSIGTAAESADLEAVVGGDDGDAVREVLSGDRESLPGMGEGSGDADADADAREPRSVSAETEPAVTEAGDDLSLELDEGVEAGAGAGAEAESGAGGNRDDIEAAGDGDAAGAESDLDPELSDPTSDDGDGAGTEGEAADGSEDGPADSGDAGSTGGADRSPDDAGPVGAGSESPTDGSASGVEGVPTDGLAAALASELRAGEVTDEDVETLREALGAAADGATDAEGGDDDGVPESVGVRIDHLASRVEEVMAYADAMEEFIDENGTARELLDDVDETLTTLRGDLRELEADAASAADERDAIADDVDRALSDLDHLEERTADVEGAVDDIESGLSVARRRIDDLDAAVETVTEEAAALDDRLDATDDDVTDVEHRVETVETELSEPIADLEAELSDVREHLGELDEFRERLNDVFAG